MVVKKEINFLDKYIKWFSDIHNKDIPLVGGKGASLGEMYNSKFPVPPGFVITAQAFGIFIENIKEDIQKILFKTDFEDTEELSKKSKEIRTLIEKEHMPDELRTEILEAYKILGTDKIDKKGVSMDALNILRNSQEPIFVSVRSSATTEDLANASFAGQHESFLNVKGETELIEFVKRCFSSLYTPRAIYYRDKKGFKEGQSLLAVIVQKMIDSEKSGVVFSKDPMTLKNRVVIEAVFGLGEGIVSGQIKPDYYIVEDSEIKDIQVADKKIAIIRTGSGRNGIAKLSPSKSKEQALNNREILEIANYAIKLEEHYKKPQDIEFCVENNKMYIVQSRPITTKGQIKKTNISGTVLLSGLGASPGIGVGTVKIINSMKDLPKIQKGDVLVTEMTNPDMVVAMQKSSAIVTDEGGMTSHASIVSREMGIPAVVGTGSATKILKDGMKITVDGFEGKIYEGEVAQTKLTEVKPIVQTRTKLKLILDLPDFADRAAQSGIDSVGLQRLEGIIATMGKHPLQYEKNNDLDSYSEILRRGIEKISEHFKLIWIRTSDIRTDEFSSLKGAPTREINPMLGNHGIRFSLKHPNILRAELREIRDVAEKYPDKKFGVMCPQIILIEEVKQAKKLFEEFKISNMEFGVMVETPAAVQIIDDICKEVKFVSLGTNDLTQFTLAVDRGEDSVQDLYNELNPAIFSEIKKVLDSCVKHRVKSSICGQAGSKKEMVEFLLRNKIDSISVNADAAHDISVFIKDLEDSMSSSSDDEDARVEEIDNQESEISQTLHGMRKEQVVIRKENSVNQNPKPNVAQPSGNNRERNWVNRMRKKLIKQWANPEIHYQVSQKVSGMDNLNRIDRKILEIKKEVREEKAEKLAENKIMEDKIETDVEKDGVEVKSSESDEESYGDDLIENSSEENDKSEKDESENISEESEMSF